MTERDKHRDRQIDIYPDRDTEDRQRDRATDGLKDRRTEKQTNRSGKLAERQRGT